MEDQEVDEYEVEPKALTALVHSVALLLSLLGNSSVVVIICRTPKLHTPSCLLMLALAIVDIMLATVWNITPLALMNGDLRAMLPDSVICTAIGLSWQVMITMSTLLQGLIAFDRYFFIVHPLKYQVHVTNRRSGVCCALALLLACALPGAILLTGDTYRFMPPAMTCSGPTIWYDLFLVLVFAPSTAVAIFSYQRIWRLCSNAMKQTTYGGVQSGPFSSGFPSPVEKIRRFKTKQNSEEDGTLGWAHNSDTPIITMSKNKKVTMEKVVSMVTRKNTTTYTTTLAGTVPDPSSTNINDDFCAAGLSGQAVNSHACMFKVEKAENCIENVCTQTTTMEETITTVHESGDAPESMLPNSRAKFSSVGNISMTEAPASRISAISSGETTFGMTGFLTPSFSTNMHESDVLIRRLNEIYQAAKTPSSGCSTPRRKDRNRRRLATLRAAAICNPVITWMLIQERMRPAIITNSNTNINVMTPGNPVLSQSQLRRAKALLLVLLPILGIAFSSLPLLAALIVWDSGNESKAAFFGVRIICHTCYATLPSAMSLLLCLTNKPYRQVLRRYLCCAMNKSEFET